MRPKVWITAGGTSEPIDGVRAVTNASTGRFGSAIARAFVQRGADVTVIGSKAMLRHPEWVPGCRTVPFFSAADLDAAISAQIEAHGPPDVFLMAAAVADYSPVPTEGKIRSNLDTLDIHMSKNPKILSTLRQRLGPHATLVGFKLLVGVSEQELASVASAQLRKNHLDRVVANDFHRLTATHHPILLVGSDGHEPISGLREDVADALAAQLLPTPEATLPTAPLPTVGRARTWWRVATPHHDSILRASDAEEAQRTLARCAPSLHRRIQIAVGDEVWLGGSAHDQAAFAARMAHLRAEHGEGAPIVVRGEVVGWVGATLHIDDDTDAAYALTGDRWATNAPALHRFGFDMVDGDLVAPWALPHRQAASVCLVDTSTRTVLLGQRKTPPVGNHAFPGGRVEAGETPWGAACRELEEETGIALDPARVTPRAVEPVWVRGPTDTWEVHCHVVEVFGQPTPQTTPELSSQWVPMGAAGGIQPKTPGVDRILHHLPTLLRRG